MYKDLDERKASLLILYIDYTKQKVFEILNEKKINKVGNIVRKQRSKRSNQNQKLRKSTNKITWL